MSDKYPEHKVGDVIRPDKRKCNVMVCLDCGKEFLLGEKGHQSHRLTLRKNATLIDRKRRMTNAEEISQVDKDMAHPSGKLT